MPIAGHAPSVAGAPAGAAAPTAKAPSSGPKVTAAAAADRHGPAAAARQAAADIDAEVASERAGLAAAYQSKREALQSAADLQAGLLLASSVSEYAATVGALSEREQAARVLFVVARNNVRITQAGQVALARNDATTWIKQLHEGPGGMGMQVIEAANTESTRMRTAAREALGQVQTSGTTLSGDITATAVNPRANTPDLDNDEEASVTEAVNTAKTEARGGISTAWAKANTELTGTANSNAAAFAESATALAEKANEKIPDAEQTMREGGEATVGLIDAMASSQLAAIDTAERQTMAAIEQAKAQAVNIMTAGQVAVARMRGSVLVQTTNLVSQEVAATTAVDDAGAQAGTELGKHKHLTTHQAHAFVQKARVALQQGVKQQTGELEQSSASVLAQLGGASGEFSTGIGEVRAKLLGAVDGAIGQGGSALAAALGDMVAQCNGFRTAAVVTYVSAETQIIAKSQPEITKAKREWHSKADEFIASCTAYQTEALAKHAEVRAGLKPQLDDIVEKTVKHLRRSTARKIWDGIKSGLGSIGKGLLIFVVAVIAVALIIVAFVGTAFIGLAVGLALLIVGAIMLVIGLISALITRFRQLWNNDWPWYAKIFGVFAAIGVAVGDVLGLSQIAESIRGKELISDRKLSVEERSARATEGTFQLVTLGLMKKYSKAEAPVGDDAPPVKRLGAGDGETTTKTNTGDTTGTGDTTKTTTGDATKTTTGDATKTATEGDATKTTTEGDATKTTTEGDATKTSGDPVKPPEASKTGGEGDNQAKTEGTKVEPKSREERLKELSGDSAHSGDAGHGGGKGLREAETALDLEQQGRLKGPVTRPKVPKGGPDKGDFLDGDGKRWDIKEPQSRSTIEQSIRDRAKASGKEPRIPPAHKNLGEFDVNKTMSDIDGELAKGESVILDLRSLNPADQATMRTAIADSDLVVGRDIIIYE